MAMTLKLKPKHPNGSVQKSQNQKKQKKFGQVRRLRVAIHQKGTELWKNQSWILHYDNAPAHTLMLGHEFLAKNKTVIMPLPS